MVNAQTDYRYDVFISYTEADRAWVEGYLHDALTQAGVRCHLEAAFALGVPRVLEFERAVQQSQRTLLVLSPAYLADSFSQFTDLLAQSYGLETSTWPVIPLRLHSIELPPRLAMLTALNATDAADWPRVIERLCAELQRPVPSPAPRPACPYPGMVPFSAQDAHFFYGREAEIKQMLQHLRLQRYLFVIGPSGSGKSSLVFAGLLPSLLESSYFPPGFWLIRGMRPGAGPLQALTQAIGGEGGDPAWPVGALASLLAANPPAQRLLLVIDQFEELFTQAERAEQSRFITVLKALQVMENCALLIAMRADFFPDLMNSDLWPVHAFQRLEIAPLRGEALRQAIQQPAADVGAYLEAGLLERLLADAANEPGTLPLLQETMVLLWGEMQRRLLPLIAYKQLGSEGSSGLGMAIAMKAEARLADLSSVQQAIARRIFVRLVQFGEGRADTRRQQSVAALRSAGDDPWLFDQTLRHLTDNRLLTLSGEEKGTDKTVDIAHEALIAGWRTLQQWLAERREAEQTRRRLEVKAAEWVRLGQGSGGLLDAIELLEAERWLASLDAVDLGHSTAVAELVRASRERLTVESENLRKLYEEADQQRREAERQREIALARQLAAQAELTRTQRASLLQRSALLALESMRRQPLPEAYHVLSQALMVLPRPLRHQTHGSGQGDVAFSDNGRCLAFAGAARFTPTGNVGTAFYLSPGGRYIATIVGTSAHVFAADLGQEIGRVDHQEAITALAFNQNERYIAMGAADGSISIWRVSGGDAMARVKYASSVGNLAFSPDGAYIAAAAGPHRTDYNTITLWRTRDGRPVVSITDGEPNMVAFSPTGQHLATACLGVQRSPNGVAVQVWRPTDRYELWRRVRKVWRAISEDMLFRLIFSLDGQYLAAASRDNVALVWDVTSGEEVLRLPHDAPVTNIAFSPQELYVATGSIDGTARLWTMRGGREVARAVEDADVSRAEVSRLAFTTSGAQLATMSRNGTTRMWEAAGGRKPATLLPRGDERALIFTKDGEYLESIALARGTSQHEGDARTRPERVVLVPDGAYAVLASAGETAWVWEATADEADRFYKVRAVLQPGLLEMHGALYSASTIARDRPCAAAGDAEIARFVDHSRGCGVLALSHGGRYLATADGSFLGTWIEGITSGARRYARVWDLTSGRAIARLEHDSEVGVVAFDANGAVLATADREGNICLWQTSTWQMIQHLRYGGEVYAMLFSRDGRRLAAAGSVDNLHSVRAWDLQESQELVALEFDDRVYDVTLTPDGQYLATAGADNIARVWEVTTRHEIARISDEDFPTLYGVEFSTDGRLVARLSASRGAWWDKQTLSLWLWRPDDVVAAACGRLTRNFTRAEWRVYLGDEAFRKTCSDLPNG